MSEHPFGVIKLQWDYDHVLMIGLRKVDSEISMMFLCYDLKRVYISLKILKFETKK